MTRLTAEEVAAKSARNRAVRSSKCPNHPDPQGYLQAAADADARLARGEKQVQCAGCGKWVWERLVTTEFTRPSKSRFGATKVAKPAIAHATRKPTQESGYRRGSLPVPTEHAEQATVIDWFASYAPTVGLDARLLIAVPNAQKFLSKARNIHAAYASAKTEGLREGAPDLFLAVPCTWFHGLWIEMKAMGGQVSPNQTMMHMLLRGQHYRVEIGWGADVAIAAIRGYLTAAGITTRSREA